MFLVGGARHLEADRQRQLTLQWGYVAVSGPELQFRIAVCAQPRQIVVAAGKEIDPAKRLRVAAVEPFSQPDDGRQHSYGASKRVIEVTIAFVGLLRRRLPMISRHECNHLDLAWIESAQISILDQVIRMSVMAIVADVYADIVEQRGVLQPFTLLVAKAMDTTCLIENTERQPRDLLRVF